MANLVVSKKCIGGIYRWSKAQSVVGSYDMGITIPQFAVIDRFWTKGIVTGVSAGGGTGSFVLGTSPIILMNAIVAPGFVAGNCMQGIDFNANPTPVPTSQQRIFFVIAVADWTAGQIAFACEYTYMDI